MTWTVVSCVSLLVAMSVMLLVAAAPVRWRRAVGDGLTICIALAFLGGLLVQTPAQAQWLPVAVWAHGHSDDAQLLPPLEELQAEAELADYQRAEAERKAEAEVAAEAAVAKAALEALGEASSSDEANAGSTLPAEAPSSGPKKPRRVELPEDFAAPDKPISIPDRPEWVDREPQMVGDNYCVAVSSALHVQQRDCRRTLDERMVEAVSDYVQDLVGSSSVDYFLHYDADEIRSRFLAQDTEFSDIVEVSVGPMHQSHAMLQFAPEFRDEVQTKWSQIRQTGRVVRTAGASVGILAMLSLMFGYFRLDSATKGYYTRRLQMVFVAAILALVAIGIMYFRSTAELIYRMTM